MEQAPWWKSGIFAAILAAAIPTATAIQGWLQSERELQLQDPQQVQQLRLAYMNVLVEAGLEGMAAVAEFAATTEEAPRIQAWARRQQQVVAQAAQKEREQLEALEARVAEAEEATRAAREQADEARAQAASLAEQAARDQKAKAHAEAAAEAAALAQRRAAKESATLLAERAKAERKKELLSGRAASVAKEPSSTTAVPVTELRTISPELIRKLQSADALNMSKQLVR